MEHGAQEGGGAAVIPCDECHQRPASLHVVRIADGHKEERNLCERCALEKGDLPFAWEPHPLQQLLAGMLKPQPQAVEVRCPKCGTTYADFARTSLLGCAACYQAFKAHLGPVLRRVHGGGRHRGKTLAPRAGDGRPSVEGLRAELREAVAKEDYELAAVLRDRMRAAESRGGA